MKPFATLLSLVLAAALAVVLWPTDASGIRAGGRPAVTPATVLPGDGAAQIDLLAPAATAEKPRRADGGDPVQVASLPAEVAPWGVLEDEFVEVLVLRAADRSPVPGAVVHVQPEKRDRSEQQESERLWREDIDLFLARFTERFPADDAGVARVPEGRGGMLYAQAPGLSGMGNFDRRAETIEVLVYPEHTLRVHVVGPGGPLAHVDVGLAMQRDRRGRSRQLFSRRTDANGIAVVTHLMALLRQPWIRGGDVFLARLEIPLDESVEVELPPLEELEASLQTVHEITLEAPPTGAVVVHVLDEAGGAFPATGTVRIARLESDELDERLRRAQGDPLQLMQRDDDGTRRDLAAGVARFTHVGLGLDLGVLARFEEERDPVAVLTYGPLVAGSEKRLDLRVGPRATVLVGRLVDGEGSPIALREFEAEVTHADGRHGWREETDAEGRFRLRFDPDEVPVARWRLHVQPAPPEDEAEASADAAPEDPVGLEAVRESLFAPQPGENELGDLATAPRPLLVAGTVVDENGEGLADVEVRLGLQLTSKDDPGRQNFWTGGASFPGVDEAVESGEDGSFQLYGRLGDLNRWEDWTARPAVQANGDGITNAAAVTFAPGAEGVTLTVIVAGSLAGRFEIEDEDWLDDTEFWVERGTPGQIERRGIRRDGLAFEADNLRPGPWDVVLRLEREPGEVVRVANVLVPRGGEADDPRLDPIELTHLRRYRIEVESAIGEPIDSVVVQRLLPGTSEWGNQEGMRTRADDEGRRHFSLVTANGGLDLRIAADEHRMAELTHVVADRTVVLSAGLEVRLTLDPAAMRLLGRDIALSARLNRRGLNTNVNFGDFREGRAQRTRRVPEPGAYDPAVWITPANPDEVDENARRRGRRWAQGVAPAGRVEVIESKSLQTIALAVDLDSLAQAVENLRAQIAQQD